MVEVNTRADLTRSFIHSDGGSGFFPTKKTRLGRIAERGELDG